MTEEIKAIAGSLGCEMSDANTMSGLIDGIRFTAVYRAQYKNKPESFTVAVPVRNTATFSLRKEAGADRFFKRIRIVEELATGDAGFDRDYYIDTYHTTFTKRYFLDGMRREAVRALFALRPEMSTVSLEEGKLSITMSPCPPASLTAAQISGIVARAAELTHNADSLPQGEEGHGRTIDRFLIAATAILAGLGFSALCASLIMYATDDMSIAGRGALIGCAVFVAFMLVAVFAARGRSSSPRVLTITFFCGLFGFPSAGAAIPLLVNSLADAKPPVEYVLKVVGTSKSTGKSTSYYVNTAHWKDSGRQTQLRVSADTYRTTRQGDMVRMLVKPGALGYEWLESYEIIR